MICDSRTYEEALLQPSPPVQYREKRRKGYCDPKSAFSTESYLFTLKASQNDKSTNVIHACALHCRTSIYGSPIRRRMHVHHRGSFWIGDYDAASICFNSVIWLKISFSFLQRSSNSASNFNRASSSSPIARDLSANSNAEMRSISFFSSIESMM